MSERQVPVIGGVQDGATRIVPNKSPVDVFTMVLKGEGSKTVTTSEYVLREAGGTRALVARGMRWPFYEGAEL